MRRHSVILTGICLCALVVPVVGAKVRVAGTWTPLQPFKGSTGDTIHFYLFTPESLDATKKYPLVLWLHGGLKSNGKGGPNMPADAFYRAEHHQIQPCFVLRPVAIKGRNWVSPRGAGTGSHAQPETPAASIPVLLELLDKTLKQYPIDQDRLHVLDVSLGNANGDKHTDTVAILRTGDLLIFSNPGSTDKVWPMKSVSLWKDGESVLAAHLAYWMRWGDPSVMAIRKDALTHYELDGTASVGCRRLMGKDPVPSKHLRDRPDNMPWFPVLDYMCSGVMDNNGGDGRPDLIMATHKSKTGHDLVVQNFGFGRFFINHEGQIVIEHQRRRGQPADFQGRGKSPVVAFASGYDINPAWSISSIVALLEDGRLFIGDSVACCRGKPIIPGTATADLEPMTGGARGNSDIRPR